MTTAHDSYAHEDDDELDLIAAIGAAWEAELCQCGHTRSRHPNYDMRDPRRNQCRVRGCRCKWFEVAQAERT
jgi:hypothetical protein